ncbi:dipeptide ABC transporter ATP-binding protein [Nocardioides sp. Iso805N]|uniref:dipeptide ABC transporter ATP-binding protein n=1 Tax=Nocardioides sp. Iso805N TaxID=1283287 RepID=UPI00036D50DE|nr:ABC transporter ATP-binding protein [Nocardioides sp. Iso805N]
MPQDAEKLLEITDLHVSFGDTEVLHGVDLRLDRSERLAIVGESGSGKSTLVGAVLGLLPGSGRVTSGSIRLAGQELAGSHERVWRSVRGERIGLVPQDPGTNLNPSMKIGAQIADALRAGGLRSSAVRERVIELMTEAGIPDAARRAGQYPHEFSGGMRQRVLIAVALARGPELLVADEPTSALDVTVQRRILDHLESLVDAHQTSMLFVTHDLGLAADRAERVVVMYRGEIVEAGPAKAILGDPQHEYTKRLVAAAPAVTARTTGAMASAATSAEAPATPVPDPILVIESLTKEYALRGRRGQRLVAADGVSFAVERGTTTAVVGESGSGKTTVAKMVLGLETPTSGRVLIDGQDVGVDSRAQRRQLRRRVQPVFQDPYGSLDPSYTVERIVAEPMEIFGTTDRAGRRRRVAELLDQVALPRGTASRRPHELSGGQRQRVAIARALAPSPDLVVCDEAVSALDVLVQDQILRLLDELQRNLGITLLFITHDLSVTRQIAHRVVVMEKGRDVEHGPTEQVFTTPTSAYTAELLEAIPGAALAR